MSTNRDPTVATDTFAQCDDCGKWVRVELPDPDGSRSIPLRLDPFDSGQGKQDKWICPQFPSPQWRGLEIF